MLTLDTLDRIFNLLPSPSIVLLPDFPAFTIVAVNDAYLKIIGKTKEQLIGHRFFSILPENPSQQVLIETKFLEKVIAEKTTYETPIKTYKHTCSNGSVNMMYFKGTNVPILDARNEVEYIIRSITDVTDVVVSKQQEEIVQKDLQEAALLMTQGQELANFGNWQWDVVQNKVSWSKTLYHIYGLDSALFNATFEGYMELLHPVDREKVYQTITGVLNTKEDVVFEERIVRPDGEIRYLRSWGKVQTDLHGNPVKMIGACLDITENKLAEIKLKELYGELEENLKTLALSEKRYSDIFHFSPLPMWILDPETLRFLDVNKAAVEHYGYTREEFLTITVEKLWYKDQAEKLISKVRSNEESYSMVSQHFKKDSTEIQVFVQSNLINFNGKITRLVLVNDITERQNYLNAVETQNAQLHEIAWIQSHVVRAPLARIMSLADLFKNYETTEADKQQLVEHILNSANELDGIVREVSEKTERILRIK